MAVVHRSIQLHPSYEVQAMKNTIREERLQRQLTQAQLAELVSVTRQTIFSIETNKYIPSVVLSLKLAKAFGRSVEKLFQLETSD